MSGKRMHPSRLLLRSKIFQTPDHFLWENILIILKKELRLTLTITVTIFRIVRIFSVLCLEEY